MSALRRGVALSSSRFCASLLRHGYRVLAFGQGNSGALVSATSLILHDPALVGDLPDDVVSIACGHFHSVAVTGEGEVFTWGRNNEGQLGHGGQSDFNPNVCDLPRRASEGEMAGARVREASASGVCTFAVAEDGRAFSWGSSKRGQLGLGAGVFSSVEPAQIACRLPLRTISAGWGHAVAIADTELGELVSWGYPVHGRLGYGHSEIGQQSQQEAPQGAATAPGMSADEGEMAAAACGSRGRWADCLGSRSWAPPVVQITPSSSRSAVLPLGTTRCSSSGRTSWRAWPCTSCRGNLHCLRKCPWGRRRTAPHRLPRLRRLRGDPERALPDPGPGRPRATGTRTPCAWPAERTPRTPALARWGAC